MCSGHGPSLTVITGNSREQASFSCWSRLYTQVNKPYYLANSFVTSLAVGRAPSGLCVTVSSTVVLSLQHLPRGILS